MIRTRNGLKAIGLCVLALGMMAFAASAAQAAAWDVNESPISGPSAALKGEVENEHGVLLGNIEGFKIEILCTAGELVNAHLDVEGKIDAGAQVKFEGCVFKEEGGEVLEACEPNAGGTEAGVVITQEGHVIIKRKVLKGGVLDEEVIVEALPDEGEVFAYVEAGEECAFGEKIPIGGKLQLQDCEEKARVSQSEHLVEEFPDGTNLWVLNPEFPASLDGSALVWLPEKPNWNALG